MKYSLKNKPAVLFLAILAVITIYSCGNNSKKPTAENNFTPVKVAHPALIKLDDNLQLNANTIFQRKEIVRATFQGFIEKIYKNIGDEVKAGEVLLLLKTKESAADDNLHITLRDEKFKGSVEVKIKSNGVFTELNHNTGDFISDGDQIAVISDPSSLRIQLNVPYQFAGSIKLGTGCTVIIPNGKLLNGIISKTLPIVEAASQTQTFLIQPKQYEYLPENLNVTVKIPVRTVDNALTIPKSALMTDETQSKFWVMKLINDSTAVKIGVIKGIDGDNVVQLLNTNLTVKDKIISEGAFGLPDTANVLIRK